MGTIIATEVLTDRPVGAKADAKAKASVTREILTGVTGTKAGTRSQTGTNRRTGISRVSGTDRMSGTGRVSGTDKDTETHRKDQHGALIKILTPRLWKALIMNKNAKLF